MKPQLKLLCIGSFVFGCLLALLFFQSGKVVNVTIPPGASATQVGQLLIQGNVLYFSGLFKFLSKLSRLDRHLKPGEYSLKEHMCSMQVLWKLFRGNKNYIRLTIPEGWRSEQIAERLEALKVCSAQAFLAEVKKQNLEGKLFPTTYFLDERIPSEKVASMMRQQYEQQTAPLFEKYPPRQLTRDQIVILASIVEREAVVAHEKPLIAAVYLNRIKKKWKLEADPTVQYALGYHKRQKTYWKKGLTYKDLAKASPYNTYTQRGLPPGPICNPGLASIQAVLQPAKIDALYFVSDQKGKHIFNLKFGEHTKAKEKVKKDQKELEKKNGQK